MGDLLGATHGSVVVLLLVPLLRSVNLSSLRTFEHQIRTNQGPQDACTATCTRPWLGKRASCLHCNLNFALSHWDDVQILFQDVKMKRTKRQDFHIGYGNVSIFLRLNDWSLLWASVSTPQVHQTHHKDGCWTCRLQTAQTAHSNSENLWRLQGQRKTSLLTMEYTVQIPPSSSPSAVGTWLQVIQTNLCLMCFGFFKESSSCQCQTSQRRIEELLNLLVARVLSRWTLMLNCPFHKKSWETCGSTSCKL